MHVDLKPVAPVDQMSALAHHVREMTDWNSLCELKFKRRELKPSLVPGNLLCIYFSIFQWCEKDSCLAVESQSCGECQVGHRVGPP
jgi:hypothetical protein